MKKWIFVLILLCSIGLFGCQQKQASEWKKTDTPQQTEPTEQPTDETEVQPDIETEPGNEPEPAVIHIIDPSTNEIIHTLSPIDLGFEMDIEAYIAKIEKLAKELARGTEGKSGYDQRMILDKLDDQGQVIKGSPLILLRENILVERIMEVSAEGGDVELPIEVTESGYDQEDVPHLDDVTIATYTTYFNPSDTNRNKNIELSAKAINNVIIGSGDHFSFNTVVGPRDEANGYQPAPEIINKKLVMGIGGGICQTSSTLFNAIDQLPVKYIERHHHSIDIGYVPKGRDATVSYGALDFRFQNTTDAPLLVKAIYGKNFLTVEIRTSQKYVDVLK
nr:VanW family protein [Sporosarcina sp. ACRSL]